ncbi:MAG: hypothetical protein M1835_006564 [Candelina submexicana]|nr:MAG: hypothetical protein M1835_006564 [Candelina submexicana]
MPTGLELSRTHAHLERLAVLSHKGFVAFKEPIPEIPTSIHKYRSEKAESATSAEPQRTVSNTQLQPAIKAPNAHERVFLALRQKNPDKLLNAFLAVSKDIEFIRSIPPATFTSIFRLLDPDFFVQPFHNLHHEISGAHTAQLGIQPIQDIFAKYVKNIGEITRVRRLAGSKLGITDYTFLLNCARAVGDGNVAEGLWRDMKWDGVVPGTTCYNHYFAAKCWSGMFHPVRRHKIRVIPYHMVMRISKTPRDGFDGHILGLKRGIKATILQEFEKMVQSGLLGDEKTFTLLMTAMAREGDTNGCKAILNKVWGVDVDGILKGEEAASQAVKEYPKTSPLRPGTDLLMTVAHVYGCNNDIPTALRLVDHISRGYSIPIPLDVWSHLLEWTFVLAVPRYGPRKHEKDGASTGKLPKKAVTSLWETMTAEPYRVRPTMPMYNREVKNLANRDMLKQMLQRMEEGRLLYLRSIQDHRRSRVEYLRALKLYRKHRVVLRSTTPIDKLRRDVEYNAIIKRRNLFFIKRWVRLLMRGRGGFKWSHAGRGKDAYTRRRLPNLIDEWRAFLPEFVIYKTPEGVVKFNSRPENIIRYRFHYERPRGEARGRS